MKTETLEQSSRSVVINGSKMSGRRPLLLQIDENWEVWPNGLGGLAQCKMMQIPHLLS